MAREPSAARADRAPAAPSGASDMSVYGATPIALGAPAIAMTLGGAPAAADSGTASLVAEAGASSIAQPTTVAGLSAGSGGSPFDTALMTPVILADVAIASITALVAPQPPDAMETAAAEPAPSMPAASGGSGTPPGLLVPASAPTGIVDETPDRAGPIGTAAPAVDVPQSAQANVDAAMDAVGQRIDAIDDVVADIGERVEAIGSDLDARAEETVDTVVGGLADRVEAIGSNLDARAGETIGTVVSNLDDRVAAVDTQIAGLASGVTGGLADIDLGPVGGSDPAGGITTLVGMVSAADMFGLPDIGGGADALTLPALGSDGGDLLGDFAPADILLTVPETHDGTFGLLAGLTDDHSG